MKYKNIIKLPLSEIQLLAAVPTQLKLRKESRQISSFQNVLFGYTAELQCISLIRFCVTAGTEIIS
jgi:hypothetical protein